MELYVEAVITDIERKVADGMPVADTVFFGGGTPTRLDPYLLAAIVKAIPVSNQPEITIECNPDDVTTDMMRIYADAGVNRISMGVQSMVSSVLHSLNRTHDPANVEKAIASVRSAGITSINLDLIYGVNGESTDDWETTVNAAIALQPTHISAYGLTVEAGTPLADDPSRYPDDDDQADKYIIVDDALLAAGMHNYEISNWALPGHECRHNKVYWSQGNYTSFGCAAHSHLDGRRWWNMRTPERYIAAVNANESVEAADEVLDDFGRKKEALELSLRTTDGVPAGTLDEEYLGDLVERKGDRVVLTRRGRLLANEVTLTLKP
jgi:oxygen-independent coproporphyrinogen-3 oxidase